MQGKKGQIFWIGLIIILVIGGFFLFSGNDTPSNTTPSQEINQNEPEVLEQSSSMSFFITGSGPGNGADLGGLSGADAHCQTLATSVGMGHKTWKAYLSTSTENARDRIGTGPWYNYQGVIIAANVEELHADNNLNKETGLDEKGQIVNGRGDSPNRHDILTGSNTDGTKSLEEEDTTCSDWTSSSSEGSAIVGHHDRIGLRDDAPSKSWVTSHGSRGCSQEDLQGTGGDGLFYCFAV